MTLASEKFASQVKTAVNATYKFESINKKQDKVDKKHEESTSKRVKEDDRSDNGRFDYIWIIIGLKKLCHQTTVPHKILLPHSFRSDCCMNNDACLIVANPAEKYEALLKEKKVSGISKVIDISSLLTEYKQFEAKRLLCSSFDCFLADSAVISELPLILGKKFAKKKKLPLPVDLKADDLAREIEQALGATSLTIPAAANVTLRASYTQLSEGQSVENIIAVLDAAFELIPGGFANIQSINVKSTLSPAFPVFCCEE